MKCDKKYIITDPKNILDINDESFVEYVNAIMSDVSDQIISVKQIKLYKLAKTPLSDGYLEINDETIKIESGFLCIAYSRSRWGLEDGCRMNTLQEANEVFNLVRAASYGRESLERALVNWAQASGDIEEITRETMEIQIPKEVIEVPCCNHECRYGKIINGVCPIKVKISKANGYTNVSVDYENEAEFKPKMDCVNAYVYENYGVSSTLINKKINIKLGRKDKERDS